MVAVGVAVVVVVAVGVAVVVVVGVKGEEVMARRQTRRSISVRAETYTRTEDGAAAHDMSVSGLVEMALAAFLDGLGVPEVSREEARARRPKLRERDADDVASGIFTF